MQGTTLFPKPQEADGKPSDTEKSMAKPTVLLEIDPDAFRHHTTPLFLCQSISWAQDFQDRFGGISLKFTQSKPCGILTAEFRWNGVKVINVHSDGQSERTTVGGTPRIFRPSEFRLWSDLENVFELAFFDAIQHNIIMMNNIETELRIHRQKRLGTNVQLHEVTFSG